MCAWFTLEALHALVCQSELEIRCISLEMNRICLDLFGGLEQDLFASVTSGGRDLQTFKSPQRPFISQHAVQDRALGGLNRYWQPRHWQQRRTNDWLPLHAALVRAAFGFWKPIPCNLSMYYLPHNISSLRGAVHPIQDPLHQILLWNGHHFRDR
jgi:hypothetical protein